MLYIQRMIKQTFHYNSCMCWCSKTVTATSHSKCFFSTKTTTKRNKSSSSSIVQNAISISTNKRPERPRRDLFSVPGADPKKIEKSKTLGADAIVLDLEDGVSVHKKDEARDLVTSVLMQQQEGTSASSFGQSEVCARINGLNDGDLAIQDLQSLLPCPMLQTIVIPKVESENDIKFVSEMIDSFCDDDNPRDIRILAAIESAMGLLNLREIASCSSDRLDGLIFASEDYCADLECIRTTDATELLFARSQIVTVAKAYDLQAIDMVHINFRDLDELAVECRQGREIGFTGKQAIHPNQIEIIQSSFSPAEKDVAFASQVVASYEKAISVDGKGACVVEGIVVDMPVYKWALKILKRAEAANMI
mmetsp:Transcript_13154/g.18458  ORF Transcript_13154/g.18458 Transcript_13154/m.18458 type:complete len:364 (-) Transcript_13154:1406-2497(-)